MSVNQRNKQTVWAYWQAVNGRDIDGAARLLHPEVAWHGFQPLRRLAGSAAVVSNFWQPLYRAIPDLIRRPYFFIGGHYDDEKFGQGDWTVGTGDFIGTFAMDWRIGDCLIPASKTTVRFRFGEFCRVTDGKIDEIRIIIDLPDLLRQTGVSLLPPSYGRDMWIPGPLAGDGVCLDEQDSAESQQTFDLVTAMIFGGINKYDGEDQASQGLERFWHDDMVWHGPVGIGTALGMREFKRNAQGPIVAAFPDRYGPGHRARVAEGRFAASTGWPSLVGTHVNPYMGWPPTGERIGWNIMDFWKRRGQKLAENWVMIDLIGAGLASGVDLLEPLRSA